MSKKPLGEILKEMEIINEEQLNQALEFQKEHNCRFGRALIKMGLCTKEDLFKALTAQYNYPYINLNGIEIQETTIDYVSFDIAKHYKLIPVEYNEENDTLRIAISPPFELNLINILQKTLAKKIEFALTTPEQIQNALDQYYVE